MNKTSSVSRIVIGAAVAIVLGVLPSVRPAAAKENPANDCLVGLQGPGPSPDVSVAISAVTVSCTDGDSCDADGATNDTCSFKIRGCVDIPGVSGCALRPIKKVKFITKPEKNLIQLTPSATEPTSVCGDFIDFKVALKKKGAKPGKRKIIASAKANVKPVGKNSDSDKITFICNPCPNDSCVPPTTSTTSTSTSTSTTSTTAPCGNGTTDATETCDGSATPNGCSGGTPYCNTTCTGCQANCSQVAFTLGAPTTYCGFPGQLDPALAPLSGQMLDAMDVLVTAGDLGSGCLYIGGGQATIVPPGPTPNGSTTAFGVADCSQNALALTPAATGNPRTCTTGPATTKHCVNGHPGTDGQGTCTNDSQCQPVCVNDAGQACSGNPELCHCIDGSPGRPNRDAGTCSIQTACIDLVPGPTFGKCAGGACGTCSDSGQSPIACGCNVDCNGRCTQNSECGVSSSGGTASSVCLADPTCIFGSPLPINNLGTSTCVLNTIADGVTGTGDIAAGTVNVTLPLKSWVYLTGVDQENFGNGDACPICNNGTCNAGPRKGLACATNSTLKTTHDCPPPPSLFLAPLNVSLSPLSTEVVTNSSDANGIFCPTQATGGAFGVLEVRKIVQNGVPAVGGLAITPKDATLASVFCIPITGNVLIDASANLAGPGSTALFGSVSLR